MGWIWVLAILLLVACSGVGVRSTNWRPEPTLLVTNRSLEVVRIYDGFGLLGTIYSGGSECLTMRRESIRHLLFQQLTSTVRGPNFRPFAFRGWTVTIHNTLGLDVLSLKAAAPCSG